MHPVKKLTLRNWNVCILPDFARWVCLLEAQWGSIVNFSQVVNGWARCFSEPFVFRGASFLLRCDRWWMDGIDKSKSCVGCFLSSINFWLPSFTGSPDQQWFLAFAVLRDSLQSVFWLQLPQGNASSDSGLMLADKFWKGFWFCL